MKRLYMVLISALFVSPVCCSEAHFYKGTIPIPNVIFDSTMDCGLNLDAVEKCVKDDRSKGQGSSFCNDVKLYAGNKQKLIEANDAIRKNPASKDMQMTLSA